MLKSKCHPLTWVALIGLTLAWIQPQKVAAEFSETASASLIPWPSTEYLIVAQNREVGDVLSELAQQHGIRSIVSESVKGKLSGRFQNIPPGELLAQLSQSFNLLWMFYNGILYVGTAAEVQTSLVTLRFAKPESILFTLGSLGIIAPGATITPVADAPVLSITGLPAFVQVNQHIAETLDNQKQFYQQGEMVIEVFPLNHAWAYDVVLDGTSVNTNSTGQGSQTGTLIRGVASILNDLVNQGGQSVGLVTESFAAGGVARPMVGALSQEQVAETGRLGFFPGTSSDSSSTSGPSRDVTSTSAPDRGGSPDSPGAYSTTQASITADVRRNAVVVRDIRENMPSYAAAIARLDVPARIIEISAAIVDMAIGTSNSLGLDSVGVAVPGYGGVVASSTGNTGVVLGDAAILPGVETDSEGTALLSRNSTTGEDGSNTTGPNILASGVFGTTQVMASLSALEQQNKARTLSRPSVLTLDNFGATISRQETFFVNSTGQYVSNLFNVSTGLSLQVIPHVTVENGSERIYLQVRIEDGTVTNRQVTQIPTVQQSTLTTQAIMNRDQSLLVGGLYIKVDQKQASGYPWLQRIPLLGYLFSVKSENDDMVERIFVITPRIVEIDSKEIGDYSQYFRPAPLQQEAMLPQADGQLLYPDFPPVVPRAYPP